MVHMKQIPNIFTLLNLICGCLAIVFTLQVGQGIVVINEGMNTYDPVFPEKMAWGALFLFLAAIIDFLDGFLARALKANSEMGKQLDSLSDVVSFGVAPGLILYQLLRISWAQYENGLNVSFLALLPAFIFPAAAAWRLAKFNISTDQGDSFRGVPTPAAGLVVASLPLVIWYEYFGIQRFFINSWFLYALIFLLSFLMVSNLRLMALKFREFSFAGNSLKYVLLLLSLVSIIFLKWLAAPVIFFLYILLSLFDKKKEQ